MRRFRDLPEEFIKQMAVSVYEDLRKEGFSHKKAKKSVKKTIKEYNDINPLLEDFQQK